MSTSSTSDKRRHQLEALQLALWNQSAPRLSAEKFEALRLSRKDDGVGTEQGLYHGGSKDDQGSDGSILPDLGPLSSFKTWLSVGSTFYHHAAQLANFDPGATTFDEQSWNNFLTKFSTFPLFLSFTKDYRQATISELSLDGIINTVNDLITDFTTGDVASDIINGIKKIGELAKENKNTTQKNSFTQAGVLSVKESKLNIGVLRTDVSMTMHTGKGYTQETQTINIWRGYGVVDFDAMKRHSDTLLQWDGQDLDNWDNNASAKPYPPNQSSAWNQ